MMAAFNFPDNEDEWFSSSALRWEHEQVVVFILALVAFIPKRGPVVLTVTAIPPSGTERVRRSPNSLTRRFPL
jgi:hypothetical protein